MNVSPSRLGRLNALPDEHRGFRIGYFEDYPGGRHQITAAWKSPDGQWQEGHILLDSKSEVPQLARECIDYGLVVEAMENQLGRKLTIDELPRLKTSSPTPA